MEDVLQDSYLNAWLALDRFRADAKVSTWLVRIVINEVLGRRRRKRAPVIPLDGDIATDTVGIQVTLMENPDLHPDQHVAYGHAQCQIVSQNMISGADTFTLLAIPFFLLAGELMNSGD